MHSRRLARTPPAVLELGLAAVGCALLVALTYRYGLGAAAAVLIGGTVLIAAFASPKVLACGLALLMPFTSLQAVIGLSPPAGLDPINLLVVLAIVLGGASLAGDADRRKVILGALIGLNLALLSIAWYRTYGHKGVSVSSLALIAKPAILIASGFLVVRLLPRSELLHTLGTIMGSLLLAVGASVVLQRLGLFHTSFEAAAADRLSFKRYGGILLDGNTAGAFLALFTVPAYLVLRATGRARWGLVVVALTFPVLLITLARGAMVAFAVTLVFLAIFDRRRVETLALVALVIVLGVAWADTGGQSEVRFIDQRFQQYRFDQNAQLSGRQTIWEQGGQYLNADQKRWVIGGGLDDFRTYTGTTSLKHQSATHNTLIFTLVTGGAIMAVAFAVLLGWIFFARWPGDPSVRAALRIAVLGFITVGLSSDMTLVSATGSWIWLLLAAALAPVPAAAPKPAPAGIDTRTLPAR